MNALLFLVAVAAFQPTDGPPATLGGDLTKKKLGPARDRPLDFRESVELQVAEKRRELISQLEELLKLSNEAERPGLLFRLGDLYSEESRAYPDDPEATQTFGRLAVSTWTELIQRYPSYERTDEALYALGKTLKDLDDDRRALIAFRRLVDKFPRSPHVPNAWLAFGDWYFEHRQLDKAVEAYSKVEGPAATLAAYKLGWCWFNRNDFERAMEHFRTVVLAPRLEKVPMGLAKEARTDFVRAFARSDRAPSEALELFNVLVTEPNDLRTMSKQLATLYYDAGRDKEAALVFRRLIEERPDSDEVADFENHTIEVLLRFADKAVIAKELGRVARSGITNERTEALFSGIAVNWHNEAKKTRADETARLAAEIYAQYLALFPTSPKASTLRFYRAELLMDLLGRPDLAAPEYSLVAKVEGKWRETAAYDAVLAYQELAKGLRPPPLEGTKPSALPPEKRALLEACEVYVAIAPSSEHAVQVEYLGARVLYDYNHLREAAERFHRLMPRWRDEETCAVPAHLSFDGLNLLQDYETMAKYADEYLGTECAKRAVVFRRELEDMIGKLRFKLCKTPACFERITGDLADEALFNAAGLYERDKNLAAAIAARVKLMREHLQSPLAAKNAWALAQAYESTADFERAAEVYEGYSRTGERARDADFNAGVLRGELGQWQQAVKARKRFLERWPKDPDAEKVMLSIAELHEKSGRPLDAVAQLEAYAKASPKNALEALGRIAKLQPPADAKRTYARIEKLGVRPSTPAAHEAVARAKLVGAEEDFARYARLKLRWTRFANTQELRTSLQEKTKALQGLERRYTEVIALGQADPGICALYKIGLLYELFAQAIEGVRLPADAPRGLDDELRDRFPSAQAREKAVEAFDAAAKKSHQLGVYNACSSAARTRLSGQRLEELPEMKLDAGAKAQGLDLLIDLQR